MTQDELSEDRDRRSSRLRFGDTVKVVLNERNRTPHTGTIRNAVWHYKNRCWHYYLEENGKKVK
ncbi:MAG: hypothetical protein GY953_19485, partial [bacterium]|nr:hypothetical protein [bacterium]